MTFGKYLGEPIGQVGVDPIGLAYLAYMAGKIEQTGCTPGQAPCFRAMKVYLADSQVKARIPAARARSSAKAKADVRQKESLFR